MEDQALIQRQVQGAALILALNRPPVNALNAEMLTALLAALRAAAEDPAISAIVLASAAAHFSAGADADELGRVKGALLPKLTAEIEALAETITDRITDEFDAEVPSKAIGELVMARLRELDKVAYVRYASIYRRFEEAEDFLDALKRLEAKSDTATFPLPGI